MKTHPTPCPSQSREIETKICEIITRLYELQHEFDRLAAPEITTEFDNAIFDCVTACAGAIAEHIRNAVFDS